MWAFILGLILGAAGKAVYDLFREEQLPTGLGLNTGRLEALAEETRQAVSSLREEVRQVIGSGRDSVQGTASRLLSSSSESEQGSNQGGAPETSAGGERLMVTASEPSGPADPTPNASARESRSPSSAQTTARPDSPAPPPGSPPSTYGTAETMS